MRPQKNSRENFFKQWKQFLETMVTVCPNNAHCLGVMILLYFSVTSKQKLSGRKLIAYLLSHITAAGTACLWGISVKEPSLPPVECETHPMHVSLKNIFFFLLNIRLKNDLCLSVVLNSKGE